MKAQSLFDVAFNRYSQRTPRSDAYRQGCLALLRKRTGEAQDLPCPYSPGTTAFDAFHAGIDEGLLIWRQYRETQDEQPALKRKVA